MSLPEDLMNSEDIDLENLPINDPNNTGGKAKEPIRPSFAPFVPGNIPDIEKNFKIISNFKKINIQRIAKIDKDNYDKEYGLFYCGKANEANGEKCELGKEICPNWMKRTQNYII